MLENNQFEELDSETIAQYEVKGKEQAAKDKKDANTGNSSSSSSDDGELLEGLADVALDAVGLAWDATKTVAHGAAEVAEGAVDLAKDAIDLVSSFDD